MYLIRSGHLAAVSVEPLPLVASVDIRIYAASASSTAQALLLADTT